jgi:hypothetical protein
MLTGVDSPVEPKPDAEQIAPQGSSLLLIGWECLIPCEDHRQKI